MAPGNYMHTTVFHSGVIESNPAAKDSGCGKGPTVEILVEPEMTIVLGRFGDDVIMP